MRVIDDEDGSGKTHVRNATVAAHGAGGVQVMSLSAAMLRALIEDGTLPREEILQGVEAARRSREARTHWAAARRNVSAHSRSLFG